MTSASWTNFQFHFIEWTDGQVTYLPATNALPGWMGTYSPTTFLSPIKKLASNVFPSSGTDISWNPPTNWNQFQDPSYHMPGTIGKVIYYNKDSDLYESSAAQIEVDSMVIFNEWQRWTDLNNQYNTDLTAYNALRKAYNSANALRIQL